MNMLRFDLQKYSHTTHKYKTTDQWSPVQSSGVTLILLCQIYCTLELGHKTTYYISIYWLSPACVYSLPCCINKDIIERQDNPKSLSGTFLSLCSGFLYYTTQKLNPDLEFKIRTVWEILHAYRNGFFSKVARCHCTVIQMQMFEDVLECRYSSFPSFASLPHPCFE